MIRTPYAPAVELDDVVKTYGEGAGAVTALDHVSIAFPAQSFTAVMGPSGSGKSSLLQCAAGLDRPTSGTVTVDGTELTGLDDRTLTKLRRERLGFVFQAFNLLPTLTVRQNVVLPLELGRRRVDSAAVDQLLARLGLGERTTHYPSELSGGQQQRVAIARAVLAGPAVIFADEPTGALDTNAAAEVLALLRESAARQTIVMVTHDPVAASYADRVVFFADGRIADVMEEPVAEAVATRMTQLGARARVAGGAHR
ncbi:ABC transporter ATP-binding protein [Kribbella sp. NPDC048928]|uniref:ABC transporter ATP-binding protein n=1 Tax=Kribbella sp. NPDC048928 TaxID=3364111 RepID=UPI00371AC4AF